MLFARLGLGGLPAPEGAAFSGLEESLGLAESLQLPQTRLLWETPTLLHLSRSDSAAHYPGERKTAFLYILKIRIKAHYPINLPKYRQVFSKVLPCKILT